MKDLAEFEREYIMQTRQEIDIEKGERDTLLNFAVGIIGAVAFGILQNQRMEDVIHHEFTYSLAVSVLVLITSLMWIRRKKLQQIADRWYVLRGLLSRAKEVPHQRVLEDIVCEGLNNRTYSIKDTVVCIALALPIYCLLFLHPPWGFIAIGAHLLLCGLVFFPKLKDKTGGQTDKSRTISEVAHGGRSEAPLSSR